MDGWNTILSYWVSAYFQGRTVSFREAISSPKPSIFQGRAANFRVVSIEKMIALGLPKAWKQWDNNHRDLKLLLYPRKLT